MTDPIIVRGPRKSILRERFRAIQREHGSGTIVAFTNGRAAHVQQTLVGLLETESITEPVYSDEGFAVVKIIQDLDEGVPIDLGENAPASEPAKTDSDGDKTATEIENPQVSADSPVDATQDAPKLPEIPDEIKDLDPPPTSGPGSGADAWRSYAAAATGTAFEEWSKLSRAAIIDHLRANGVRVEDKSTPVG